MATITTESKLQFFSGFYYGIWDYNDDVYYCEDETGRAFDDELDEFDNKAYEHDLGKDIVMSYNEWLKQIGLNGVKVEFIGVTNPQCYNYTTDSIDVNIEVTDEGQKNIRKMMNDNKELIAKMILDDCTSYDGFWSWLSNDFNDWDDEKLFSDKERYQPAYLSSILDYIIVAEFRNQDWEDDLNAAAWNDHEVCIESYITFNKNKKEA